MKTFIHHDLPKIERVENADGSRLYRTPTGNLYPSVTTIVGFGEEHILENWKAAVGEEEANKVSKRASARGTRIHSLCEEYLKGNSLEVNLFDQEMFNQFKPELDKIDEIHCLESQLYSDYLKVAGTVDCLAKYNGKLAVIDFKTSSRVKYQDEIPTYFQQTSAYAVAFEERTGIPVSNLVIIMGIDESTKAKVFVEKRDNWVKSFQKKRFLYYKAKGA